jgi:hypothetical protein
VKWSPYTASYARIFCTSLSAPNESTKRKGPADGDSDPLGYHWAPTCSDRIHIDPWTTVRIQPRVPTSEN